MVLDCETIWSNKQAQDLRTKAKYGGMVRYISINAPYRIRLCVSPEAMRNDRQMK
ncbi:hypothetical protein ACE1CI_21900 [Aerosakkonemataceae cyanobacterium BLCC-F50]|uniref:Uncharacterized protein n=1 Tax=Floridaenema flaviceps BLCC-F50 TaxID=3153642 RepID=A0ABV4XV10_9CYAN